MHRRETNPSISTQHTFTMPASCFNESIDQELSLDELGQASGGILPILGGFITAWLASSVETSDLIPWHS